MSGESIFDNVDSIYINNKEVQLIKRVDDGAIIYEKAEPSLILGVTGSSFEEYNSSTALTGDNIIIDYGDGTIEPLTSKLSHTYNDGISSHEIKIYNVTSLNDSCFRDCAGLTSITISEGVTSLGNYCFYGCTGLTSITIPEGVTSLGINCFSGCTSLTSITIPEGVTSLGSNCFRDCTGLTSITIPEGVTSLGISCFRGCTGLTSITIPDSITILNRNCFGDCTSLTSITLNWTGADILTYDSGWVTNANSNLKFKIPAGTKQLYIDKDYPADKLEELSCMTLTVTGSSFSTNSSTPFTYNDKVFVDWGDNTGLIEYNGGQLSHTFNDGLNSHTIKVYGDLTSLEERCFFNCKGLTSITIPNGVTSLGEDCFNGCTSLTSITIPDSVTSLNGYCFRGCTSLTSITIPNGVTNLGRSCFSNCVGLTSITIPDSVTSLGLNCFIGCTGLTSITIPNGVTNLGSSCFFNCVGLTSIILNWTETDILTFNSRWITNANSNLKFKIPIGTTQLYIDKGYPADKLEEFVI